jgi:regulator of sirC expression with transglutaminase-like and TPR domain
VTLLDAALEVARCGGRPEDARAAVDVALGGLVSLVRRRLPSTVGLSTLAETLCVALREDGGIRGDPERWNERDASFVDRVLETGHGLPIALAVIQGEVARRLGLEADGIDFPGHFLLRLRRPGAAAEALVDPFAVRLVDRDDCTALLRRVEGPEARAMPGHFSTTTPLRLFLRMCTNLKQRAAAVGDPLEALAWSAALLGAEPALVLEHRDRALLLERIGDPGAAARELATLEEGVVEPGLRERVRRRREALEAQARAGRIVH